MTLPILGLVLIAALAHAVWNLLAKGAQGGAGFVWLYTVAASVLYLPVLVAALLIAPGPLGWTALVFMAGSGALHTVYASLLQRGYRPGALSLFSPLARGTGPLLSTVAAIAFFGERPGIVALAGGGLIVLAVLALARPAPGAAGEHGRAARIAVLTGVAIAGYTLWDKHAVDALALSPIVYYWGQHGQRRAAHRDRAARPRLDPPRVAHLEGSRRGRGPAEPARLRARPVRAGPRAGQRRGARPRAQHPRRHPARHDGARRGRRPAAVRRLRRDRRRRRRAHPGMSSGARARKSRTAAWVRPGASSWGTCPQFSSRCSAAGSASRTWR